MIPSFFFKRPENTGPRRDIFKASALWADAFYKSKCPSVCVSVRVFVRLFTCEVPFKRVFAPTSLN